MQPVEHGPPDVGNGGVAVTVTDQDTLDKADEIARYRFNAGRDIEVCLDEAELEHAAQRSSIDPGSPHQHVSFLEIGGVVELSGNPGTRRSGPAPRLSENSSGEIRSTEYGVAAAVSSNNDVTADNSTPKCPRYSMSSANGRLKGCLNEDLVHPPKPRRHRRPAAPSGPGSGRQHFVDDGQVNFRRIGVLARQWDVPWIAPVVSQIKRMIEAVLAREVRLRNRLLYERHEIDEIRSLADNRLAVPAFAVVLIAEEIRVSREASQHVDQAQVRACIPPSSSTGRIEGRVAGDRLERMDDMRDARLGVERLASDAQRRAERKARARGQLIGAGKGSDPPGRVHPHQQEPVGFQPTVGQIGQCAGPTSAQGARSRNRRRRFLTKIDGKPPAKPGRPAAESLRSRDPGRGVPPRRARARGPASDARSFRVRREGSIVQNVAHRPQCGVTVGEPIQLVKAAANRLPFGVGNIVEVEGR